MTLLHYGPHVAYACGRPVASLARVARRQQLHRLAEVLEAEPIGRSEAAFQGIVQQGDATFACV